MTKLSYALAAMEGWKQATLRKDPAALDKLFHKDMTYTHSSGLEQDKKACIDLATAPKTKIEAIEFSDMTVRMYGDIAIVKTNAAVTSASSGHSATSHIIVLHVWLKTPQGWQTIARQATRASH
jgi:ketosteroid isomerase-like protein